MSATPLAARGVHFEDISASDFGTPLSAAAPTSIDYLNAQLVAHGFAHGNGLNLSELRGKDQQVVLKCLANMLGQRLDDMGRSEQLSAKYKTLSYDHERLIEQHRAAKDAAAQAEREMETGKAKVESAQKRLTAEEEAHRKAREDHQRLKMAMQYLRTTTAGDIKRKEKEIEKMSERWGKIANEQVRLGAIGAGLACANLLPEAALSEENSMWEAALADSEAARLGLLKENDAFRDVILACANVLQTLHHTTVSTVTKVELEEPELILSDTLFVTNPASTQAETAQEKLRELFGNLREALSKAGSMGNSRRQSLRQREEDTQQIQALQVANATLQLQLQEAQEAARAQGQQLLDQFVSDARFMAGQRQTADLSMELMATPARDILVDTLEEQRKHLESERDKFTEAALGLGREKAALEAERLRFLEEKRAFMVQSILDDLPATPEAPGRPATVPADPAPEKSVPGLAGSSKPAKPSRVTRKPSPPLPPVEVTAMSSKPAAVPVLSKVSEATTLPALNLERGALGASTTPPMSEGDMTSPTSPTDQLLNAGPPPSLSPEKTKSRPPHLRNTQTTPVRPTFSQGRMQHKYSPAVPSPLSRMVRIVESPPSSPESKAQKGTAQRPPVIAEEDEEQEEGVSMEVNVVPPSQEQGEQPVVSDEAVAADVPIPQEAEPRPGSLSPLSRILHMGLSPAIAPTLALSSFPGLLGTGSLAQDLLARPKPLSKGLGLGGLGFGNIPGGFQLGTAITGRVQANVGNGPNGGARMVAKTVKTIKLPAATTVAKEKTKPKKAVFGENRPRSSKESTSSSGSGESGESRSSATSSKRAATSAVAVKPRAVGGVMGKENEAKRKAAAAAAAAGSSKVTAVKKPTSVAASGAVKLGPKPLAPAPLKKGSIPPAAATKPASGKGWKG